MGMLGIQEAAPLNTVKAESAEQFYGAWKLSRVMMSGYELPVESLENFGLKLNAAVTLSADSLVIETEGEEQKTVTLTSSEFTDGELTVTAEDNTMKLQLTDAGELVMNTEGEEEYSLVMVLTPAE